ncbi:MAG: DUF1499 domain-containing protein [Piscirickettsiaceae bacterium]|jgi:uncharacterized protein (DUF1499 family)|nr:DUF1499 domain-containing protein [Piscirickettsiaceae bacterium]
MLISSALIIILAVGGLALFSKSGNPPGLINEQLISCPNKPNCISSENSHDQTHYIAPISLLPEQQKQAMIAVKTSIIELGGEIQSEQSHYLASTFSSKLFGFVDDVEIRVDTKQSLIHLRSASRIGYSDLGANKKRATELKNTIQHHLDTMIGTL